MSGLKSLLASPRFSIVLGVATVLIGLGVAVTVLTAGPQSIVQPVGDDAALTLSVDKSILLLGVECTTVRWESDNLPLVYPDSPAPVPTQGTAEVCAPDEGILRADLPYTGTFLPPILWVSPTHIIGFVLAMIALVLLLRRPAWLGTVPPLYLLIAAIVVITSISLLYAPGKQVPFQFGVLSVLVSLGGMTLAYVYRDRPQRALLIACASFAVLVWLLISRMMLQESYLLHYDERYYLSIAATASGGHGLYPSLQDYSPMPMMGGVGYAAWLYAFAYQILGPSVHSLRLLSLAVSLLSIPPVFILFRRWYGTVTAWVAVAVLPPTLLYLSAFSIRMDSFTIVCLWWAILLVDTAFQKNKWYWHLAAGLWIGLCLQVHIDTSIMAVTFGLFYVIVCGRRSLRTRRLSDLSPLAMYSLGALIGLGVFIAANVLPYMDAFFRTAGNAARFAVVSADPNAPLADRLVRSFTALDIFVSNFIERWYIVFQGMHPAEIVFWGLAFLSLFWRRWHRATLMTITLSLGVVVVGFFILNTAALAYTTHLGPALLLCVPPFFTYGFQRVRAFDWAQVSPAFVLVLSACVLPVSMTAFSLDLRTTRYNAAPPEIVAFIKAHVSTQCSILGEEEIFLYDLPMYSLYYSAQYPALGLRYFTYEYNEETRLWDTLAPDVVILTDQVKNSVAVWVRETQYEEIAPSVWKRPTVATGCVIE